jgi:hypothetical protein
MQGLVEAAKGDRAAGEMELPHPADSRVVQRPHSHPIGAEPPAPATQRPGVVAADMLELADGVDAIERPLDGALITELEVGSIGEPGAKGARATRRCTSERVMPVAWTSNRFAR